MIVKDRRILTWSHYNLIDKLKSDYNVKTQVVESGPQAVDNRIKVLSGDQARKHNYNMDGINI